MKHPRGRALLLLAILLSVTLCVLLTAVLLGVLPGSTLRSDVAEVVQLPDRASSGLTCQMEPRSRTGYCLAALDQNAMARLIDQLRLTQLSVASTDPRALPPVGPGGCQATAMFGDGDGVSAYWIGARPTQLALRDGGQFEYLLLLSRAETGQACIQVAYAYG